MEAADLFARDKNIAVLTRYQRVGIVAISWVEAADLFARDKNIAVLTRYERVGTVALLLGGGC